MYKFKLQPKNDKSDPIWYNLNCLVSIKLIGEINSIDCMVMGNALYYDNHTNYIQSIYYFDYCNCLLLLKTWFIIGSLADRLFDIQIEKLS